MRGEGARPGSLPGAAILIVEGDITEQDTDAIVKPANPTLLGGGGADGAIHRAAGPGLREEHDLSRSNGESSDGAQRSCECRALWGCRTGESKITGGHGLRSGFMIHTVGPVWQGGGEGEDGLLAECYRSSLRLAGEQGLASIAFPAISTGTYGFPLRRAAGIAVATVLETLPETPSIGRVVFVCHGREAAELYRGVVSSLLPCESPPESAPCLEPTGEELPGRETLERVEAHLITIESAYGIRIANFTEVLYQVAGGTADDREILAIATAISSYVALHLSRPEMEIPGSFLDEILGQFAGRACTAMRGTGSPGITHK